MINNEGNDQMSIGIHSSLEYCVHYVYTTLERLKYTLITVLSHQQILLKVALSHQKSPYIVLNRDNFFA